MFLGLKNNPRLIHLTSAFFPLLDSHKTNLLINQTNKTKIIYEKPALSNLSESLCSLKNSAETEMNPKISLRLVVIFRPLRFKGTFFQSLTKKIGENIFILKIKNHTDEFDFNYFQFNKNKMRKNISRNPQFLLIEASFTFKQFSQENNAPLLKTRNSLFGTIRYSFQFIKYSIKF